MIVYSCAEKTVFECSEVRWAMLYAINVMYRCRVSDGDVGNQLQTIDLFWDHVDLCNHSCPRFEVVCEGV
jgi:hypothetical protein